MEARGTFLLNKRLTVVLRSKGWLDLFGYLSWHIKWFCNLMFLHCPKTPHTEPSNKECWVHMTDRKVEILLFWVGRKEAFWLEMGMNWKTCHFLGDKYRWFDKIRRFLFISIRAPQRIWSDEFVPSYIHHICHFVIFVILPMALFLPICSLLEPIQELSTTLGGNRLAWQATYGATDRTVGVFLS